MSGERIRSLEIAVNDLSDLGALFSKLAKDEIAVEKAGNRTVLLEGTDSNNKLLMKSCLYVNEGGVPLRTLSIQTISVGLPRTGIGTKLFNWVKQYAILSGFDRLEIESCVTEDSQGFSEKMGLTRVVNSSEIAQILKEEYTDNYELLLK